MPSLDLPNLAAIRYQLNTTPPPIARAYTGTPIGPGGVPATASASPAAPCYTGKKPSFNLACEQGATLNCGITLVVVDANGVSQPLNITGNLFQFTAKLDPNLPDTAPGVVTKDWTETVTPTQGTTWLQLDAETTLSMQVASYFYQVRMISSVTSVSPIVTPLFSGTLAILQPVSTRS